jgi:predicted  nucleic acid-binding Zn-ribbon protein
VLVERRAELRRLNANYDTTREELLDFANAMEVRIQESRRGIFDARAKLIAATTDDEWDALTKVDTKAMKAIARCIQGI